MHVEEVLGKNTDDLILLAVEDFVQEGIEDVSTHAAVDLLQITEWLEMLWTHLNFLGLLLSRLFNIPVKVSED